MNCNSLRGVPWTLATAMIWGVGLTLGHRLAVWLLGVVGA